MPLTKAQAKSLDILEVARSLGMEMKRKSHREYYWAEHDSFKIDTVNNVWRWYSRSEFGDVIQLVQTIQGVTYKEAMHFLETGEFKKVDLAAQIAPKEPFYYNLEKYEHRDFKASRSYLKTQRGLSDDTINFFLSQGSIAEATRKKGDYFEPVIVFKYKDNTGFLAGASLQGIVENRVHYPERGRLKQIMRNSDGQLGFSIDIGTPKRLVFAEAPIDLMSYYELHKDTLQDVRLVAMDGVKEGIISRRFMELYAEMNSKSYQIDQNTGKALETVVNTTDYFKDGRHQDMITLVVDNDAAGQNFITRLQEKGIPVQIAIPPIIQIDQEKEDWNDFLKRGNEATKELVHVYSADEKSWHYQGYFSKEIALAKAQELTADDVKAFVSDRQLTKEEVHQEYKRIINQEKERKHTMSEVHEAEAEYEAEKPNNSRLAQAKRKLERLKGEADEAINAAYSHQSLTNGQPMNDKRGGGRFMQKQEQIENRVFSKLDEIKEQEERIERLQEREDRKAAGLNRQGNGLDMSVQNIPRIREEIEKAERGESSYRPETIKRYKKELERLEAIQDKVDGLVIQPETQALIDAGEVKQWAKQPNIYFVKGLRRVALELTEEGRFELSPKYRPNTDEEKEMVNKLLSNQKKREDETQKSALTPDTSNLSPEDAEWLNQNWNNISFSVEPKKQMVIDSDKTVTYEKPSNLLGDDRGPKKQIQSTEKAPENSQEQMNDRTSGGTGSLQPKAEGSTSPVLETSTFEQTVTSHPTSSYPYLQFSTNYDEVQRRTANYHPITPADLRRLNQYAPSIQSTAIWYLNELVDSKISFVYANYGEENVLQVTFQKDNFIHLSGIRPFEEGKGAANFLDDIANGQGHYDGMLISNAIKDKLQVLPMLRDILDPHSFVLDDLSSVEKLHNLNMSEAIKAKDEDFLLLFKDIGDEKIPASLMKLKGELGTNVKLLDEKIILGVYREREGHIEQLSINEEYVKDKGAEMLSVLKNKQYEEIKLEEQPHNKQELERDADADGVSDEEELLQGTNPYDFRSKPGSKPEGEESLQADEVVLAAGSLAVADFIQNKDMAGLSRHLKEGIKEFLDSDKYKDYLTKMSQLNNYSNRNLRLILAQNPEARQVASFKQWKENFDRYVKKGEKALRIFKPMTKIKKDENNQPILDKNGKPETVTFFGLVPVFDVSQTEGKEMPKAAEVKEQLTDLDYANLYRALMAIAKENDVSVRFEEMENNKHGYYSVPENQIVLRSNEMNKAQIIKTFLHEMAHAELHHADNPQKENLTRSTAELQAESVAYVVSSYYGIDTSEYSFNYLSGWSADKETLADLEAQLDIVQQEAKSLMVRMDQELEQLRLSQEKQTKNSFEQKIEKFKNQSKQAVEEHKQELKAAAQSKKEKGFSK